MKITIYVLNNGGEVYQTLNDIDAVIRILSHQIKYLKYRTVIVQKGQNARVWENAEDLQKLGKEMREYAFAKWTLFLLPNGVQACGGPAPPLFMASQECFIQLCKEIVYYNEQQKIKNSVALSGSQVPLVS